jgi:hypothetical protein
LPLLRNKKIKAYGKEFYDRCGRINTCFKLFVTFRSVGAGKAHYYFTAGRRSGMERCRIYGEQVF